MNKKSSRKLKVALFLLVMFVLWTVAVRYIDVSAIGPQNSSVGFSALNSFVHSVTGVHMTLYIITDWLGLVPFALALIFAISGLVQLIKRKSLFRVDRSILALGVFYIAVMAVYVFFEYVVINYRPVLIGGILEASYPSSTTMLVTCVMSTALTQAKYRIKNKLLKTSISVIIIAFTAFMIVARLISGVHWLSDIVGGALISTSLVLLYDAMRCNDENIKNIKYKK